MDLAQATNAPEEIDLGGEARRARLLTLKEWGVVSAWLKRENPSPVTRALLAIQQAKDSGEPVGQAAQDELLDHAQRSALSWPPRLGSTEWLDAIERVDGGLARLLFEVLSKVDPAFTLVMAEALAPRVTPAEWGDLLRVSLHGIHPRPKAGAGGGTAAGASAPRATTGTP